MELLSSIFAVFVLQVLYNIGRSQSKSRSFHALINSRFRFITFLPDLERLMMRMLRGPRGKYMLEEVQTTWRLSIALPLLFTANFNGSVTIVLSYNRASRSFRTQWSYSCLSSTLGPPSDWWSPIPFSGTCTVSQQVPPYLVKQAPVDMVLLLLLTWNK